VARLQSNNLIADSSSTAHATVHIVTADTAKAGEVELRLRSSLSAHNCAGYEITWNTKPGNKYVTIVRWNGPSGNFSSLKLDNTIYAKDGDVIKATIIGSTITAYLNGVQVLEATDTTYTTGQPGVGAGFYLGGGSGSNSSTVFRVSPRRMDLVLFRMPRRV